MARTNSKGRSYLNNVHRDVANSCGCFSLQRGQHDIRHELVFKNHDGYIFHDSSGFESGGESELNAIREFVREKATEKRLNDRLHAIW